MGRLVVHPDAGHRPDRRRIPLRRWPDARHNGQFLRKYLPYTHGGTDAGEPATLCLWDLAALASLTYRNYGEFVATVSADDLATLHADTRKGYPDTSPTLVAVPAKLALAGHFCAAARN